MSDVSGIPYMGPMGQGNFFAPSFSYNPQLTAGAIQSNYMPEAIQGQNVFNNLYGGGANAGFGRQTDYYSQLGANYLAQVPSSWENRYAHGAIVPESLRVPGGNYADPTASPYQTTPNVWDTGASPFQGGGGSSGLNSSIYGGSGINWGDVGRAAAGLQMPSQSPFDFSAGLGAGMFGGLGGAGATPGAGQLDWTKLYDGGGADPSPGMKMPGGLNSPMATPQPQQQPTDYSSLFGRGVGGTSGAPSVSETAPAPMPKAADQGAAMFGSLGGAGAIPGSSAIDWLKLFGGMFGGGGAKAEPAPDMAMPGGLNSPMTTQQQQPIDYGSLFGRGAGGTGQPQPVSTEGFDTGTGKPNTTQLYTQPDTQSADSLAEQAKGKLADLMNPMAPEAAAQEGEAGRAGMVGRTATGEDLNPFEGERVPMPRARPEGADAPRPPADIPPQDLGYLPGRSAGDLKGVNQRFSRALQEFAREYNGSNSDYSMSLRSGLRSAGQGFHTSGNAMDINLIDRRNGERLNDYQTRDPVVFKAYQDNANAFHTFLEKNYPDLAAGHRWGGYFSGGTSVYGAQDIMHHDLGGLFGKGMAGGSWQGGLNQQSADTWSLPYGGGTKTPWPTFNLFPNDPENRTALTYKSGGSGGVPTQVYQLDAEGNRIPVPILSSKAPGETTAYQNRGLADAPRPPGDIPIAGAPRADVNQGQEIPRPAADVPSSGLFPEGVPLPAARPNAEANLSQAHSLLDTNVMDLVRKNSPSSASMVPSSIASQSLREALGNTITGGMIRSNITPENLAKAGITQADFDKAYAQGRAAPPRFGGSDDFAAPPGAGQPGMEAFDKFFKQDSAPPSESPIGPPAPSAGWDFPQEGTPRWNTEVYEPFSTTVIMRRPENQTIGGASHYADFRRQSGDVIDRRNEQPSRDELARLKAVPYGYIPEPEQASAASNPMSIGLGLGDRDLPTPRDSLATTMARPQRFAGAEDDVGQLLDKYGPEALWAAQGQSQFPQGQTQPLDGNDVSRMPYTQQSPIPGASFPVQLYDDPRYGQATPPPAEAPPQPFPGAQEITQQPYQPSRSDEGNPFFSPTGGSPGRDQLAKLQTPAPIEGEAGRAGMNRTTMPRIDETTNLPLGPMSQSQFGDPFNPENYNTLDQAFDLAQKRAAPAQELLSNPALYEKAKAVSIAEIGPDINKRSDADIAGFFETMLNNRASGARAAEIPTMEQYLGPKPKGYYEPIRNNQQSMNDAYATLQKDPALSARIDRIFQEVVKGSNVSNLSTQNAVQTKNFAKGGEGSLQPQYGGVMGQFVPGPGEYYTSMLNPYNNPAAERDIGKGAQDKYREFYRSLMPPGPMPWEWGR